MTRSSHLLPSLPAGFCKSHTQSRNSVGAVTQQPKFDLITRRPRLRKPFAAILAKTEHVRGGLKRDKAEQPGPSHANGREQRKQEGARVILNGSDDEGNVLQGQEEVLEANKNWLETAFPQYLQSEKDDFCDQWDEALRTAERRKSSLAGKMNHRSVSPDNPIWQAISKEAARDARREPLLSSFMYASILSYDNFQDCLAFVLANRLSTPTLLATECYETFQTVFREDDSIVQAALADLAAIRERDPSCNSYSNALLFYKGYHAIQVHRIAHHLWNRGLEVSARALQARVSEVFAMDIHPQAKFGKGILMDHGTGIVVGQTAEIGNNVSILQNVTLGGTGKDHGDRHPKVQDNVLIGAAATVLGNITIGKGAMVAAGSLVLKTVPPKTMVAGSPAKEIGKIQGNPALKMQHWLRSLNAECDPFFSEDFESMMRTKSEQASRNGAGQESREQHSGATTEVSDNINLAYENESEFGSESEEEHQIGPIDGQRNSNDSRQVDDRGPVHHKVEDESPVVGVRSDLAAQRLWPKPEEPEYYL